MEPLGARIERGECVISYRCVSCGIEKKNKAAKDDDFEVILPLLSIPTKQKARNTEERARFYSSKERSCQDSNLTGSV